MKDVHKLMNEIVQLTSNIETNYPEVYKYLDENPITIPANGKTIDAKELTDYLNSLKGIAIFLCILIHSKAAKFVL